MKTCLVKAGLSWKNLTPQWPRFTAHLPGKGAYVTVGKAISYKMNTNQPPTPSRVRGGVVGCEVAALHCSIPRTSARWDECWDLVTRWRRSLTSKFFMQELNRHWWQMRRDCWCFNCWHHLGSLAGYCHLCLMCILLKKFFNVYLLLIERHRLWAGEGKREGQT